MRAAYYSEFEGPVTIESVADPEPAPHGVVIRVEASGLCLSDWHGWKGHDPDITLPHVPGHELAGVVEAVGQKARSCKPGDRVTVPFVCGCGACPQCDAGQQQVCDRQFQPGFTHWGSFAEYVAIDYADVNLVHLPESIDFVTAASLGCRFATAFRAVMEQGKVSPGQWVAVHGCGGVGLSAIMIARAAGARPIAIDISDSKLRLARKLGAVESINARSESDIAGQIMQICGGAHVSIDALGDPEIFGNSITCLRKHGRHIQVGILDPACTAAAPTAVIIARELQILGSHGMQAHRYPPMIKMISDGALQPWVLVGETIGLDELPGRLANMDRFDRSGVSIVDRF
ncbi:MAG: zinc-dependent alcohol dehydrogenase family protein [Xanthomonadales bacterium]|nr:zinc-dependent alcohol dehydrogenase family protein [Xanthomonadales bacterium]